ncbi:dihydrofolate reductase family protein [Chitinophaga sp. sic0106]|uniref:dihydrofolate reductase family protein n=1 Tax=Chitinophaga sp. sic0106 TaxID=2854785 RepID=UPI001C452E85|nr:dihydrofolate reductase [Chitinophaga sp. sic0106]MBV7530520.1 dihydrofolate reductase family protein [Chitinophaga sp. sic0106]
MKVTLIANISANGKVLLATNPNHQIPQEASSIFMQLVGQAGNLVVGKKTFDLLQQFLTDPNGYFAGITLVLLSSSAANMDGIKIVQTPQEAIDYLATKGFQEVIVGGGTHTYNAFINQDLVTDIYFNIHPLVVGDGGVLGTNTELASRFEIQTADRLRDDMLQLHLTKK